MTEEHFDKLSLFCNIRKELVIEEQDVHNSIYEVPIELAKQQLDQYILDLFKLPKNDLNLDAWHKMLKSVITPEKGEVEIAVVGKYISLRDAYKSIYEALAHGGYANDIDVKIRMIEAEEIEAHSAEKLLSGVSGILVPGGFGHRGIEGKISAVKYARENSIPFFGICLGMHCVSIEFARNVCNLKDAHSFEFNKSTENPVIDLMEEQKNITAKGGTMRLGAYSCNIKPDTKTAEAYLQNPIQERHRHRYEFNSKYIQTFEEHGMVISGTNPETGLVEIIELPSHPWMVACQFHPEFKSTPLNAHPLFKAFINAAYNNKK